MPSLLVEDLMLCRFNSFVSSGLLLCAVNRGKPCYCLVFRQSVFFHEPPNEGVEARTSAGVDNMTWFRRVGSVVSSRFRARLVGRHAHGRRGYTAAWGGGQLRSKTSRARW